MGAALRGPVLVAAGNATSLLDLDGLKPIECKMPTRYDREMYTGTPIRLGRRTRVRGLGSQHIAQRHATSGLRRKRTCTVLRAQFQWLGAPQRDRRPHLRRQRRLLKPAQAARTRTSRERPLWSAHSRRPGSVLPADDFRSGRSRRRAALRRVGRRLCGRRNRAPGDPAGPSQARAGPPRSVCPPGLSLDKRIRWFPPASCWPCCPDGRECDRAPSL